MRGYRFQSLIVLAVVSQISLVVAQDRNDSLEELGRYLLCDNQYDRAQAAFVLRNRQKDGEDISSLVPVFKQLVVRSIDPQEMAGVEGDAAEFALLNLMKVGDQRAIEHFLVAQDYYFQTQSTPTADVSAYLQFYEHVDVSHYDVARSVCEKQYQTLKTAYRPHEAGIAIDVVLYLLERFGKHHTELVQEVNYWREQLDHQNWGHFTPLIVQLADHRGLLADIASEIRSMPAERLIEEPGHLETLAAVAPFRKEAASLLASHFANKTFKVSWSEWIEIYVDSAQRLSEEDRQNAYVQLRRMAQEAYDHARKTINGRYNNFSTFTSPYTKPQFFDSNQELKHEVLRVFGEEMLIAKEGYKRSLKLNGGFGSSF